ncbi:hypothetical protein ACC691_37820, partial [Rhizobium johnstonii]|uniref:hypothetical protein n=1 Tax=Rhizobium johnstonii TaxID=3019933 RepID=UPI003F98686B
RESTRTLSVAFEAFARHWSSQLTSRLGAACTVRSTGVAVLRYDDYVSGLPAPFRIGAVRRCS